MRETRESTAMLLDLDDQSDAVDAVDLPAYFRKAATPVSGYLGQLDPSFQGALSRHHADLGDGECDFYHTVDLPDGRVIEGEWDLRRSEATYLGGCDLAGQRVIEYGPASGGLSSYIARRAGELVVFDLPFGGAPELVPFPGIDMDAQRANGARSAARLRNSWWYTKHRLGYAAKAVYGDIYDPPADLGRFEIAVFGCILLHLSHPFRALQKAAAMTTQAIVVTDVHSAPQAAGSEGQAARSMLVFNPSAAPVGMIHWWALSPETVAHMLRQLGFDSIEVTLHSPTEMASRPRLFTVVGRRSAATPAALPQPFPAVIERLRWPVPPPNLRFMVSGTEELQTFLALGQRAHEALVGAITTSDIAVGQLGRVLDFGCGVGRVTRYWDAYPNLEVVGTDYFPEAIAWSRDNLRFAHFETNELAGPLRFDSGSFGLVYALSVFTHLPVDMQMTWFGELVRVLRPGGLLYFTTHGPHYRPVLDEAQRIAFDAGDIVVTGDDQPGTNHCAAFHPPDYVTNVLVRRFDLTLLQSERRGAKGNPEQDSYLLRKA